MLTLLFNQVPAGAIVGSVSTDQGSGESQGNALWFLPEQLRVQVLSSAEPAYGGYLVGEDVYPVHRLVEISGDVLSWQAEQQTDSEGQLGIAGVAVSTQRCQVLSVSAIWGVAGECSSRQTAARACAAAETIDLELELLTIMLGA